MPADFNYYPYEAGEGSSITESRWTKFFRWMRTDGVLTTSQILPSDADLYVSAGFGRSIQIETGEAMIKGTMFIHSGSAYEIAITENPDPFPRIDLLVLRNNFATDITAYAVVEGEPAEDPLTPTPEDSEAVCELPLASILVQPLTENILDEDITDLRVRSMQGDTGSNVIPFSINAETIDTATTINPNMYRVFNLSVGDDLTVTISDFSSSSITSKVTIYLIQDGTGGHTVTFSGNVLFPAGIQPANTENANSMDMYEFEWNGTHWLLVNNTSDYA